MGSRLYKSGLPLKTTSLAKAMTLLNQELIECAVCAGMHEFAYECEYCVTMLTTRGMR